MAAALGVPARAEKVRERMGVEPLPVVPLEAVSGLDAPGWAEQEFGDCALGDPRRTRRLVKIVREQAAQPSGAYAQASGAIATPSKGIIGFSTTPGRS